MANAELAAPSLEFIFAAHVTVDLPLDLGDVGKGGRRIVPIASGDFEGPRLRGTVMPGGADWQILRSDGVAELEARYTLRTDDGALIMVRNHALRHGPAEIMAALAAGRPVAAESYYFRGATFFETSAAAYRWLTSAIVVCTGQRDPAGVRLRFYQVL
jgi:hypothetical protein